MVLRRSTGWQPPDAPQPTTWSEIWDYWQALADLLTSVAHDGDRDVAEQAARALPEVLEHGPYHARPEDVVAEMEVQGGLYNVQ